MDSHPFRYLFDLIFNDPWTNELTHLLSKFNYFRVGNYISRHIFPIFLIHSFVLLKLRSIRLVGIVMNVFVKKAIISYVKFSVADWVRLGFCGLWVRRGPQIDLTDSEMNAKGVLKRETKAPIYAH